MSNCKSCQIEGEVFPLSGEDCGITNTDPLYDTGNCVLDENGNPVIPPDDTDIPDGACIKTPSGLLCPAVENCSPFDLSESTETCFINDVIGESIEIGGAPLNVYRLLGVHEQGSLQDLTGAGTSFSNGYLPGYSSANAFDKFITEYRSLQIGADVVKSAFLGYDFGPIKLNNGRARYGIETAIKHDVSRIQILQGCDSVNRVSKIRIERSNDGEKWFGAAIQNLPDCDGMVVLNFARSVPSRFWRIRPVTFNGGPSDYWSIKALQFIDYEKTKITNIQDKILLENRDRDYDETAIKMKCAYQPIDTIGNQTKFGYMPGSDKWVIEVSFTSSVKALGRPFVIGDIIELPSETQYNTSMTPIKKYLEVEDTGWSVNGYTPTWVPTLMRLIAVPAIASQETQDLFGKLTRDVDSSGLVDIDNGQNMVYQDYSDISQTIKADANTAVPERGEDMAKVAKLSDELLAFSDAHPEMNLRRLDRKRSMYSIDALPPNGESYTEGDEFPAGMIVDGAYHRQTYDQIGKGIAPRLYRYSKIKGYWVYLETDRRYEAKNTKPILQQFLDPERSSVTKPSDVGE